MINVGSKHQSLLFYFKSVISFVHQTLLKYLQLNIVMIYRTVRDKQKIVDTHSDSSLSVLITLSYSLPVIWPRLRPGVWWRFS